VTGEPVLDNTVEDPPEVRGALAEAGAATSALLVSIAGLGDGDVAGMTALPGWTVGHVLTHLARNADGNRNMAEGARRGEEREQYPHGRAGRDADIQAGAGRSAAELIDDVRTSAAALAAAWAAVPAPAWSQQVRPLSGPQPLARTVRSRIREVEIHRVDLGLGYSPAAWPAPFVRRELGVVARSLTDRLPRGTALRLHATDTGWTMELGQGPASVGVSGPAAWLLAWVTGRPVDDGALHAPAGLPPLAPW